LTRSPAFAAVFPENTPGRKLVDVRNHDIADLIFDRQALARLPDP